VKVKVVSRILEANDRIAEENGSGSGKPACSLRT